MDLAARKHFIIRSAWFTIPAPLLATGIAYSLLPPIAGLEEPGARLALAARWLVVAMLPYAIACGTIAGTRFFEGSHDPTKGGETERLKILCRVMQNTLEQLVWFAIVLFALAGMVNATQARVIPVVCAVFAIVRLVYWWGYTRSGTLGRAPGVQLTFSLNAHMLGAALFLLVRSLLR